MKTKTTILSIVFILASAFIFAQNKNSKIKCDKYANFGETELCLPKIAGMTECYSIPIVKKKASRLLSGRGMLVLAFYLPNQIYEKIDVLDEIPFEGFFFAYGQENMKNVKGSNKDLDKVVQVMKNSFSEIEWNLDDLTIDDKLINVGKPVLLETYSPHNSARTIVGLTYTKADDEEYIGLSIMNMMIIKEKLIMLTGYYIYKDKNSIIKAKSKNDYFVLRFLDEN